LGELDFWGESRPCKPAGQDRDSSRDRSGPPRVTTPEIAGSSGHNEVVATGKRAGARRARPARAAPRVNTRVLGLAAGITLCVVAWGYLVYAAIDFGGAGRSGSSSGWAMLALASAGAMACLFVGLMLASRL